MPGLGVSERPGDAQRRAIRLTTTGTSGAVIVGIPFLTTVAAGLGWRAAFVGLALLALGTGALVRAAPGLDVASISLFESRAAAEQSTQRAADWVRQHVAALLPQPPVVTAGEVVLHGTP